MHLRFGLLLVAALVCAVTAAHGQTVPTVPLHARPVPMPAPAPAAGEPADPPARRVDEPRAHLSFQVPAGWQLSHQDGEYSTFRLDARSAPARARLLAVAMMDFNPFPRSTFAGAMLYLSEIPSTSPASCTAEAHGKPNADQGSASVGDVSFAKGYDAHGKICTEARDTVYTTVRHGACLRFDLTINTFCGGEVSGARDMTNDQLANIERRLEGMLDSVQFTAK